MNTPARKQSATVANVPRATDLSFSPTLQNLAARRPLTGRSGRVFKNYPLSKPSNLIVLRNLVMERRPERTLEVGLACGGSAIAFAKSDRDLGRPPSQQHIAIDPFQTAPQAYDSTGLENLRDADIESYVRFVEGLSNTILPRLLDEDLQVDLAYIDGSHLFEDVFVDLYYVHRLLSDGGIVCFDDCAVPDVRKAIRFIVRNLPGHLEEVDLSIYRTDGGRSLKYRMASLVGKRQLRAFIKVGPSARPFKAPFRDF